LLSARHAARFVSNQLLRVCQIASVGRRFGTNIAELKINFCGIPCSVKTGAQRAIGKPLAVAVL